MSNMQTVGIGKILQLCRSLILLCIKYDLIMRLNQLQTYDKARNAVALALSPVVRALVDPDGAMQDIRNLDSVSMLSYLCSTFFCLGP